MEEKFRGIVLYNLELNGNLNGVYTNNLTPNAEIFTETNRRINVKDNDNEINDIRNYDCFYYDFEEGRVDCSLRLIITNGIYRAEWIRLNEQTPIFIGEGFRMNERQIAISYWLNA